MVKAAGDRDFSTLGTLAGCGDASLEEEIYQSVF